MYSMKPHNVAGTLEVPGQVDDGVVVDAALNDGVDLDGSEPHLGGAVDGMQDAAGAEATSVHLLENLVVNAVQADGDAVESGVLEVPGLLGQQVAVGGQRDVGDAINGGHLRDQLRQISTQQGLAAGDARLAHSEFGKQEGQGGLSPRR